MRKTTAVKGSSTVEKAIPEDGEGLNLTDVLDATDGLGRILAAFEEGDLCEECFFAQLKQVNKTLTKWTLDVLLNNGMIKKRSPKALQEVMEQLREINGGVVYSGSSK